MLTQRNFLPSIVWIARASFVVYWFFVFFGTSMPFQPRVSEVDQKGTSNIVNQFVFSSVFLASFPSVWVFRRKILSVIKQEKFLTVFLFWCGLTILWSAYPFVSFKRYFQILTTVVVSLGALGPVQRSEDLWPLLRPVLYLYVLLSLISVILVPGAIDPKSLTWRGLAPSKNHLGQAALVATLFWTLDAGRRSGCGRIVAWLMVLISCGLLQGSHSITALVTLIIMIVLWTLLSADNAFQKLGIGHAFFVISATLVLGFCVSILLGFPKVVPRIFSMMGKDPTFTGRTDLWWVIWNEAHRHLFFGAGFGGFWVINSPWIDQIYEIFVWLPNQAHMGYLDILNETGVVGLLLFFVALLKYFIDLIRSQRKDPWKWFIIAALIVNFQESTLFRQNVLTGVLFLFAYLSFYHDLAATDKEVDMTTDN